MSHEQDVANRIDGAEINNQLIELANIGGIEHESTEDHPIHLGSNRMALTHHDLEARENFVAPLMAEAGMDIIDDHPLSLVGRYPGQDASLDPVLLISHIDTVPDGDIYDGVLGVIGGIAVVKAIDEEGITPERDILVVSLTGEESSRFNIALFGSRALFQGLTEDELVSRKPDGPTIAEALGEVHAEYVQYPAFGPHGNEFPTPYASVELHVEQDKKLLNKGKDIGIVEHIAAPVRFLSKIGTTSLEVEESPFEYNTYLELQVNGNADHSGATPMGEENRADGLLETVVILSDLGEPEDGSEISIGDIEVYEQAMNKVPGLVSTKLRIGANTEESIAEIMDEIRSVVEARNFVHADGASSFKDTSIVLNVIEESEAGEFFRQDDMVARQKTAFGLIESVNKSANHYAEQKCVGTVGTYDVSDDGVISLGVDLRGMTLEPREAMVAHIEKAMESAVLRNYEFDGLGEVLPGSGEAPVILSRDLVNKAVDTVSENLPDVSLMKMDSAAGHDTQNVARAGIPAVMIFAQSKDGIAHDPEAYTSPENIDKAVKALAVLTVKLANEVPDYVRRLKDSL